MAENRWKRWMVNGILMFLAAGVCLAVAEVILRQAAPLYFCGIQEAYQYDAELGYRLRPGIHLFKNTDHLEEIRTNALGTVNFEESFRSFSHLIFAVGDSYTQGTGMSPDTSYPFQLSMILNVNNAGRYEPKYGVVNLGLASFGVLQGEISLKRYAGLIDQPDIVLYLGSENDHEDDIFLSTGYYHKSLVYGSPSWGVLVKPLLFLNKFELFKRAKLAVSNLRRSQILAKTSTGNSASISVAEQVWPHLENIIAYCRERNILLIVSWSDSPTDSYYWLKAKAEEEGIPFADWRPSVESVLRQIPGLPFDNPHSGGHHRAWVMNLVAQAYAREIEKHFHPAEIPS